MKIGLSLTSTDHTGFFFGTDTGIKEAKQSEKEREEIASVVSI